MAKFIEITDLDNNVTLINVDYIISVEAYPNFITISFQQAGQQSTYGIKTEMTLQDFKDLI